MNTENHTEPPTNQLPEAARDIAHSAANAAREARGVASFSTKEATHAMNATKDVARRVTGSAKEIYQTAAVKSGETLETSKAYVRQNPVPVVLGAIAFGAALGYLVILARRKPTFGERYADEPMDAVREAILGAFSPVTKRVHRGYDSARDGAGRAMDRFHQFGSGCSGNSFSDRVGRIGSNLKFW